MTLLALSALTITCGGCAAFKRPLIHPLPQDFILVDKGATFTAPKNGAYVSDYFLSSVMGVDVDAPKDK